MLNSWPSYTIRRSKEDWGWVLESEWVRYRTCCPATLAMGPEWLDSDGDDSEYEDSAEADEGVEGAEEDEEGGG